MKIKEEIIRRFFVVFLVGTAAFSTAGCGLFSSTDDDDEIIINDDDDDDDSTKEDCNSIGDYDRCIAAGCEWRQEGEQVICFNQPSGDDDDDSAEIDSDGDGLSDTREAEIGSDPNIWDTDKDGLSDGDEVDNHDTDPLDPDSDDDGLDDKQEATDDRLNPNSADSDGDGFSDYAEIYAGTEPDDPNSFPSSNECTDNDSDGYGDGPGCLGPDCQNFNPDIHPGAYDTPNDGIDQDCVGGDAGDGSFGFDADYDGLDSDGEAAAGTSPVFPDTDHDGLTDGEEVNTYLTDPTKIDSDGDGYNDGAEVEQGSDPKNKNSTPADTGCVDADSDGYGSGGGCLGPDCDDANPIINPAAFEWGYNGVDEDCAAGDYPLSDNPWQNETFPDQDGDGYTEPYDCDDNDSQAYWWTMGYYDGDMDNFGVGEWGYYCTSQSGMQMISPDAGDCDDTNSQVSPGQEEVLYDGLDNDCDPSSSDDDFDGDGVAAVEGGGTDCNDMDASIWELITIYYDGDYDGYGVAPGSEQCRGDSGLPDGEALNGDDCQDNDASVNPGITETPYNNLDDDCDAGTPDTDLDGDGYDSDLNGGLDCDDQDATVNPYGDDFTVDGTDQNCDGVDGPIDEDGDGHATIATGGDDCDDMDANVNPAQTEIIYNGKDDDCDSGTLDDDLDSDGYDSDATGGGDCDDADPSRNPGAMDTTVDGTDQDCDGADGPNDADSDGYDSITSGGSDCADLDPFSHPGGYEIADDGVDNDCAGGDLVAVDGPGLYVAIDSPACSDVAIDAGTKSKPYCSLSYAAFKAQTGNNVFVAGGVYESATVYNDGAFYGGYNHTDWSRDRVNNISRVESPSLTQAFSIQSGATVIVEGFEAVGMLNAPGNQTSSGIAAYGYLIAINNDIYSGSGGNFTVGVDLFAGGYLRGNKIVSGDTLGISSRAIELAGGNQATIINNEIYAGNAPHSTYGILLNGDAQVINNIISPGVAAGGANPLGSRGIYGGSGTSQIINNLVIVSGDGYGKDYGIDIVSDASIINNIFTARSVIAVNAWISVNAGGQIEIFNNHFDSAAISAYVYDGVGGNQLDPATINLCGWSGCLTAGNNQDGDPMFIDSAGGDFHLLPGSPAIDSGVSPAPYLGLGDLGYDLDLLPRPIDGDVDGTPAIDIGPYEKQP